ncbi:MAG: hypothetical protein GY720_15885 [bacterium]|nr:hypothetical protein [bacterium]
MSLNIASTPFTSFSTTQNGPLGQVVCSEDGVRYCYVYNAGADALVVGDACSPYETTPALGHISSTVGTVFATGDGTDIATIPAGIAISAIPAASYGWIWCGGQSLTHTITTDASVVKGDPLVIDDGGVVVITGIAALTGHGFMGWALATDASLVLTGAILKGCCWDN